ncbi:MAG: hypothetical protein LBD14_00240 [Puniceicoccales bacterium]|jgi:hypothetical protein|nr:hypothetical protein [Puniceicoccales bacterium]
MHSHSRLTRIYFFLANNWNVPLAPGHYLDLLVLLPLAGLFVLFALSGGGMADAGVMGVGARLTAVAMGAHILVLAWRIRDGFRFQQGVFLFVPWLLWCLADWLLFSPRPWLAETGLIVNCMVFVVFALSLHHLRGSSLKWIVGGAMVAVVSVVVALTMGQEFHFASRFQGTGTAPDPGLAQRAMAVFCGSMGHPAAMGAVLLMLFFPCCAVALGTRWKLWQRLIAMYFNVILLVGIFATAHAGVMAGLLVGVVLLCVLVARKMSVRFILVGLAMFGVVWSAGRVDRDVGVFRTGEAKATATENTGAPLAQSAWRVAGELPLRGTGAGGFPLAFEADRPAGWTSSPVTPGSLPLALLAEHGIVGALLLLLPAGWVWFSALNTCLAIPLTNAHQRQHAVAVTVPTPGMGPKASERHGGRAGQRHHRRHRRRARLIPERRVFLGGALAGTGAAAVLLCLDYPGPMPVAACLAAFMGAAMFGHVKQKSLTFQPRRRWTTPLRIVAFAKPAAWLLWVLAPLAAMEHVKLGKSALDECLPAIDREMDADTELMVSERTQAALNTAETAARAALGANPSNGDAWSLLARVALRRYTVQPDKGRHWAQVALQASAEALRAGPTVFDFHVTRGAALLMIGQRSEALRELREAHRLAPFAPAVVLMLVDALGREDGGLAEARTLLGVLARRYPDNAYVRQRLGFFRLGVPEDTSGKGKASPPQ